MLREKTCLNFVCYIVRSMTPKVLPGASVSVKAGLAGLSPEDREVAAVYGHYPGNSPVRARSLSGLSSQPLPGFGGESLILR
jgi:hypothetical protein